MTIRLDYGQRRARRAVVIYMRSDFTACARAVLLPCPRRARGSGRSTRAAAPASAGTALGACREHGCLQNSVLLRQCPDFARSARIVCCAHTPSPTKGNERTDASQLRRRAGRGGTRLGAPERRGGRRDGAPVREARTPGDPTPAAVADLRQRCRGIGGGRADSRVSDGKWIRRAATGGCRTRQRLGQRRCCGYVSRS